MRISRFLANFGAFSRRQAARLIEAGRIQINGRIATHASTVEMEDSIEIDGVKFIPEVQRIYYIYNKPVGVDCNCRPNDPASIINIVNLPYRYFPVGRLDKDSRGLLLLTNDGELAQQLLHPTEKKTKCYEVSVDKPILEKDLKTFVSGLVISETCMKFDTYERLDDRHYCFSLSEGKNRQIRKMLKVLGYRVTDLKRINFAGLTLNALPEGSYRPLSSMELAALKDKQ